jgi:hypothetical protein
MTPLLIIFWTTMIFISIFWYAFLLFYVGAKGGKEIKEMTRVLGRRPPEEEVD